MTNQSITENTAPFREWSTWYSLRGALSSPLTPLVVLHGGPGVAHDYLLALEALAATGRPVIFYDQLGCGNSTHLPEKGEDFWTVELFLDELDNLLGHLGIAERYHLLGQSWGGMLAAEHATRQPAGLRSLVLSNSPASMELWMSEARRLRDALPPEQGAALDRHEEAGTIESEEYLAATQYFYDRHVCRVIPNPPELLASMEKVNLDPTVYHTMNGPNEFFCVGSLREWSIIDRLHLVSAPTLLASGRFDEATPATVQPYADLIGDVRWEIFEASSHMPFVEENERYMKVVGDFLAQYDGVMSTASAS